MYNNKDANIQKQASANIQHTLLQHFFRYYPDTKTLQPFELKDQEGKNITGVGRNCFDQKGNIYISSFNNGFYIWKATTGKLLHINRWDVDAEHAAKTDNNIYPCIMDHKGNIWFSSGEGVYEYDPEINIYYHHLAKDYDGIPQMTETRSIAEDKLGHFWICTLNNGLYEWYVENGKGITKNYNTNSRNALPSDYCLKIMNSISDSSLWISFNTGLARFDPVAKKITSVFNQQRGFLKDDSYTFLITAKNE